MGGNRFSMSDLTDAGCCGCFGFLRKHHRSVMPFRGSSAAFSSDYLLPHNPEDVDRSFYNRENPDDDPHDSESGSQQSVKRSEEIILARIQNGLICRDVPVKETRRLTISKDENGNKMINEYVRQYKIGSGSYGKVVLYRNTKDGKLYAIKVYHRSYLSRIRVGGSETALSDVLREISIMKLLDHPNIVNLIENIIHRDIKPDNLLVTSSGMDDNDVLRRSPGTPVFSAPECYLGSTHHGIGADVWAVGVTLYCMILGQYPFVGENWEDTYEKIVNNPLYLPDDINPQLKDLLEGLLWKDPEQRIKLRAVAEHPWVVQEEGPIPEYECWCRRDKSSAAAAAAAAATTTSSDQQSLS
ncbi:Serine/threonine-protein kinase GRIK2 [Ananas comosus]|uniref:Serine/threonine-protein kinase GRIK2 n=1 Tax=Ananas comosus TaxID=4615 RepID=A0A199V3P5_ANACO|nr:Serine/threonine-protein kinase GRIK2 [Ananas comosus]